MSQCSDGCFTVQKVPQKLISWASCWNLLLNTQAFNTQVRGEMDGKDFDVKFLLHFGISDVPSSAHFVTTLFLLKNPD